MPRLNVFLLLFVLVSRVETYWLVTVGRFIGALLTVGLVVSRAIVGALLLCVQGLSALNRVREARRQGAIPARGLVDGVILLLSGALLLASGFVTDTVGLVCLVPVLRRTLVSWVVHHGMQAEIPGVPEDVEVLEDEFWGEDRYKPLAPSFVRDPAGAA